MVKGRAKRDLPQAEMPEATDQQHIDEIQNNAIHIWEILCDVDTCDLGNVIHAAKVRRLADIHASRAKAIRDQLKVEVRKAKAKQNSCKQFGVKNL